MPPKQTDLGCQLLRDVTRQARPHACGRRATRGDGIRTPQTIHTDSETCQQSASSQAVKNLCNLCHYWPGRRTARRLPMLPSPLSTPATHPPPSAMASIMRKMYAGPLPLRPVTALSSFSSTR